MKKIGFIFALHTICFNFLNAAEFEQNSKSADFSPTAIVTESILLGSPEDYQKILEEHILVKLNLDRDARFIDVLFKKLPIMESESTNQKSSEETTLYEEFVFNVILGTFFPSRRGTIAEKYAKNNDCEKLKFLAFEPLTGWDIARHYVCFGYAYERYGFDQNPEKLERLAKLGLEHAQHQVIRGYAHGENGFEKTLKDLIESPDTSNWKELQFYHADALFSGVFGFEKNIEKLQSLADQGVEEAQRLMVEHYKESSDAKNLTNNMLNQAEKGNTHAGKYLVEFCENFLKDHPLGENTSHELDKAREGVLSTLCYLADNLNDENAQKVICSLYAEGKYGYKQDGNMLLELAKVQQWEYAKQLVCEGFAEGKYGFQQNPDRLYYFAYETKIVYEPAKKLVAEGYAKGKYGLKQKPKNLIYFAEFAEKNEDMPILFKDAQRFVAEGYAKGEYGFDKDLSKLLECAAKNWEKAEEYLAEYLLEDSEMQQDQKVMIALEYKRRKQEYQTVQKHQKASVG